MKLSSNIIRFYQSFGIEKTIDIFSQVGISGIDFNNDIKEFYDDTYDKAYYLNLKKYVNDKGIDMVQAHAPFGTDFANEQEFVNRIVKGMEKASWIGAPMIVVHPCKHLDYKEVGFDKMFEYNYNFYKGLVPYAEEYGIKIAIENINNSLTEKADALVKLYEELKNPVFTVCFDAGHCNVIGESPAQMVKILAHRIGCTHIHDNDGSRDQHTLPFYGTTDWEAVVKALADADYKGDLNYEASCFIKNVPEALYYDGAVYMSKVGHYLIDRFNYYKTV